MFITLDEYYPVHNYNEALEAMKNNGITPKEFISIKSPYHWYIEVPYKPILINYDELPESSERWIINKVQALRPNEEYLLRRRDDSTGANAMLKYTENEPLRESRLSEYSVFFDARNKEQLLQITKEIPIKIWYFGKYKNNKIRLCLCSNKMILNYLNPEQIILEKNTNEPGRFEAELNFKIFRGMDMLQKYTETEYYLNGQQYKVSIKSDRITTI
jgi:hypothetical protein